MNSKVWNVLILLVLIFVLATSGCSKAESDPTISEQHSFATEEPKKKGTSGN